MTTDERLAEVAPLLRSLLEDLQDRYGVGNVTYIDSDHAGGTAKTLTFAASTHVVTVTDT
jgi:hypothetical protein